MPRRVIRRRRALKKAKKPVRRYRRRLVVKRASSTPNYAIITEGAEDQLTLDVNGNYSFNFTTSLSEFQRAQEVAHSYKYYRAKKVELTFIPYANIASYNAVANQRLPQLYFQVDRVANQYIAPTEDEMIERGVKPRLFKKKMTFSWKPSLLQNVQLETGQSADGAGNPLGINTINAVNSVPLFNKWLPTQQSYGFTQTPPFAQTGHQMAQPAINPYALRYYGAVFVINQEDGTSAQSVGDLITRVTWEFKGPRALKTDEPQPQTVVSDATSMINPGVIANSQPTNYP